MPNLSVNGQRLTKSVVIIGGGLAGLAAGTRLAENNIPVTILEKNPYFGGRATSFIDADSGDSVDYGQHVMIGAYQASREFFERIGVFDRIFIQARTEIRFRHPIVGDSILQCGRLPAPLNLVWGLGGLTHLSIIDKLAMARLGAACYGLDPERRDLDLMTVSQLLARYGQTRNSRAGFWELLTVAVLNEKPETASAALLLKVMRETFLSASDHSRMWFAKTGLSELYPRAAVDYIQRRGGMCLTHQGVTAFEFKGNRLQAIQLASNQWSEVDRVICAIPPFALRNVIPPSVQQEHFPMLAHFQPSCIIGINLWWDRPIIEGAFVGLIGSPIEWVFDKSRIYDPALARGSHLALVMSAANAYANTPKDEILKLAKEEMERFFPKARNAEFKRGTVLKSKHATFSQRAGMAMHRPGSQTPFDSFVLAGDWTKTGLPATMESAVLSGHRAATLVLEQWSGA